MVNVDKYMQYMDPMDVFFYFFPSIWIRLNKQI